MRFALSIEDPADTAYGRGVAAGRIDERLAGHDEHFQTIANSLTTITTRLTALELNQQALGATIQANHAQVSARIESNAATALAAREALSHDLANRRQLSEMRFAPVTKILAVMAGLIGLAVFVLALIQFISAP